MDNKDGGATQTPTASNGATCSEIAACAAECADGDQACADACIAKGSDEGKAAVRALERCASENACSDSACMTSKCKAEVDACRAQQASAADAPAGGAVPAALVGTWTSNGGGAVIIHTYRADGSYHESSGLSSSGSCPMTTAFEIDGKVDFTPSTVTYHEVSGTTVTKTCSSEGTPKPISPDTVTKSWRLEGGVLYTWDATCNDYKTCAVQFTK